MQKQVYRKVRPSTPHLDTYRSNMNKVEKLSYSAPVMILYRVFDADEPDHRDDEVVGHDGVVQGLVEDHPA